VSVYLDPMIDWGKCIGRAGPAWCHMMADTIDELHAMADRIGMKRRWFQNHASMAHYDLGTHGMRARAVAAGAIECDRNTFVGHMRRLRTAPQRRTLWETSTTST